MHTSRLFKHVMERSDSISPTSSCPSTPPPAKTWPEPPPIDLRVMTDAHRDQVFELVASTFFRDEPLNRCLAFDLPHEPVEFAELVLRLALDDRCSFVAVDVQTQKIVGVILNIIKHRALHADRFHVSNFASEKLRFILNVLQHAHGEIDLFEQLHTERLLHVVIIAIDANYRGLRLTEKLIHASLERAKTEFRLAGAFSEATSLFSAKAFRKQGFQVHNEIVYTKYDPIRLGSLAGEHDRCQLLAKQL